MRPVVAIPSASPIVLYAGNERDGRSEHVAARKSVGQIGLAGHMHDYAVAARARRPHGIMAFLLWGRASSVRPRIMRRAIASPSSMGRRSRRGDGGCAFHAGAPTPPLARPAHVRLPASDPFLISEQK